MQFDYEQDSVEYAIERHVREQVIGFSHYIKDDQIIVKVDDGKADFSKSRTYGSVCTEILTVFVIIASKGPLARDPILRAFPRVDIKPEGFELKQEYVGHKFRNCAEVSGSKGTAIQLKYEHNIKEVGA